MKKQQEVKKEHYIIRRMREWHECMVYCTLLPPSKVLLLLRRRNGVKIVSSSLSCILCWLGRKGKDMKEEQIGRVKRNESDEGISLCSFQTPLFSQSGKLDLLKLKLAKNALNSSAEEEASVET